MNSSKTIILTFNIGYNSCLALYSIKYIHLNNINHLI